MKIWPWKRELYKEGYETWTRNRSIKGVIIGEPFAYDRHFVIYKITNVWTGNVKLKKVFI